MSNETSRTWQSWVVPMVFGFVASTLVVALLVPPRANSLTWPGVALHSAGLLGIAAAVVVAGIWAMHRTFDDYIGIRPSTAVLACAWSTAIWLPLLFLLRSEQAVWVIAAPLPMAVIVSRFARRRMHEDAEPVEQSVHANGLFSSVTAMRSGRMAHAAVAAAVLLQGVAATGAAGLYTWSESLLILLAAVLVWGRSEQPTSTSRGLLWERRWRRSSIFPCFLLTCLALTPFLRAALQSTALTHVVMAGMSSPVMPYKSAPASAYSGFILTTPPMQKRPLTLPSQHDPLSINTALHKELLIPFDGVYWFFVKQDGRPGADAPVERGDPTTKAIRTLHRVPLMMEAHQRLGATLSAGCCGALAIDVRDADNRLGILSVEVVLRERTAKGMPSHSLGIMPIRASTAQKISLTRDPVDERLRFSMRNVPAGFRFNEIAVVIHPAPERNLASARVKVKDFALEP